MERRYNAEFLKFKFLPLVLYFQLLRCHFLFDPHRVREAEMLQMDARESL